MDGWTISGSLSGYRVGGGLVLNPGNSAIAIPQGAIFKRGFRRFIRYWVTRIVDASSFLENNFCRRGCVPPVLRTSTRQDGLSYKSALVEARDFSGKPASWSLFSWPIRNQMITFRTTCTVWWSKLQFHFVELINVKNRTIQFFCTISYGFL